MALIFGEVLHLVGHIDKRNTLNRPQHARERLLGVQALIDIGGIRGNARRGLLGYSGCGCGNGAKRKRQRQAGDNSRMLGLHTSSLHECSKSAVCKDGFSIAARPLLHNNPSVDGNNPPRNLKGLNKLVVGRQQKLAVTLRQAVPQLTESGDIDVQDALNQILSELVVIDMDVRITVSEHV